MSANVETGEISSVVLALILIFSLLFGLCLSKEVYSGAGELPPPPKFMPKTINVCENLVASEI